jgi:hypothetical protein
VFLKSALGSSQVVLVLLSQLVFQQVISMLDNQTVLAPLLRDLTVAHQSSLSAV